MYSVLLSRPEQFQLETIARVISNHHKIPAFDARRTANRCWGFIGEHLEKAQADGLAGEMARAGMEAVVVEEKDLAGPPAVHAVHAARCAEDGFVYTTGSDPKEKIFRWKDVLVIGAAGLQEETLVKKTAQEGPTAQQRLIGLGITLATGIPVSLGKKKEVRKDVKQSELYLYMDVFAGESEMTEAGEPRKWLEGASPETIRLHINGQEFNYASLAERRMPNVFANFRLVLKDISERAVDALKNKGAAVISSGQPLQTMGYTAAEDYEKECRWLLTLTKCRRNH